MNIFMDLLFARASSEQISDEELYNITDMIHGAPFITNRDLFNNTRDYILKIYNELLTMHAHESCMIGFGLAELVIEAGSRNNYLHLDKPNVSLQAREDKAYLLLQRILIIDPTITQASNERGINLLQMSSRYQMHSIVELLLRYSTLDANQLYNLALTAINNGSSPKLIAKFLTAEIMQAIDDDDRNIDKQALFSQLTNFKRGNDQFRHLSDSIVIAANSIVNRCVKAYVKALYPYYQELRDHYLWREKTLEVACSKLKKSVEYTDQIPSSKQVGMMSVLGVREIKNHIFNFLKPSYKQYQTFANDAYEPLLVTQPEDLALMQGIQAMPNLSFQDMQDINHLFKTLENSPPDLMAQVMQDMLARLTPAARQGVIQIIQGSQAPILTEEQVKSNITDLAQQFFEKLVPIIKVQQSVRPRF